MFSLLSKVTKHCLTEKDGESYDIARVLWAIGTLIFFGLSIYTVIQAPASFNYVNWGIAFASVLAAGSAGIKLKESTEQSVPGGNTATQLQEK